MFALFRTTVWIVDRTKRDSLARLLLENVTSTSADEKLDEKLAALTLHPPANDRAYFGSVLGFCDLMGSTVPPPSSDDQAWWDRHGTHQFLSYQTFTNPLKPRFHRSHKWCLCRYGSGRGAASVDKSIRLTDRLSVVVLSFTIRRRTVHGGSARPVDSCSSGRSSDREKAASITLASEQTFLGSFGCF